MTPINLLLNEFCYSRTFLNELRLLVVSNFLPGVLTWIDLEVSKASDSFSFPVFFLDQLSLALQDCLFSRCFFSTYLLNFITNFQSSVALAFSSSIVCFLMFSIQKCQLPSFKGDLGVVAGESLLTQTTQRLFIFRRPSLKLIIQEEDRFLSIKSYFGLFISSREGLFGAPRVLGSRFVTQS